MIGGTLYVAGNPAINGGSGTIPMAPCGTTTSTCTLTNHTGSLTVTLPNSGPNAGSPNLTLLTELFGQYASGPHTSEGRLEVVPTAVTVQ